jgi:hypothetical protein
MFGRKKQGEGVDSSVSSEIDETQISSINGKPAEDEPLLVPAKEEKTTKIFRQGPWIHPYPLITGLSITALLVVAFFGNILINRYSEELSKTDYFHSPPNLAQLIVDVQKSTMLITCGNSQGSGWVIALGDVVNTADPETKALDKAYPGSVITNHHLIKDCIDNRKAITTSNGGKNYDSVLFSFDAKNDIAIISTK